MIININKKKILIRLTIISILIFTVCSLFFRKNIYSLNILFITNIIITILLFIDNSFNIIQLGLGKTRKEMISIFNHYQLIIIIYDLFFIMIYLFLQIIIKQTFSFPWLYIIRIFQLCIITSLLIYISLIYGNIINIISLLFLVSLILLEYFLASILHIIIQLIIILILYLLIIYIINNKKN